MSEATEPAIVEQLDDARGKLNALDALLRAVLDAAEAAIDNHPGLTRTWNGPGRPTHDAKITFDRAGWTVAITATGSEPRGRSGTRITGCGDTLDVAVLAFIDSLDAWAEVLK